MAYASESDITALYGEAYLNLVADRDGDGLADSGVVSAALARADAEIDPYLSTKYSLPMGNTPAHLVQVAVDIAIYRMAPDHAALTDDMRARYKDAIKWLTGVAKGDIHLGIVDPPASHGGAPVVLSSTRRLSRSSLDGLF